MLGKALEMMIRTGTMKRKTILSYLALSLLLVPASSSAQCRMYYYDQSYSSTSQPALIQSGMAANQRQLPLDAHVAAGTDLVIAGPNGADKLYFTSPAEGAILRAELNGSSPETAVDTGGAPGALAANNAGTEFYWADMNDGELYRVNSDGTGRTLLLDGLSNLGYLLLDESTGWLYWTEDRAETGAIKRVRTDGSGLETLFSGLHSPKGLALDSQTQTLWWVSQGTAVYPVVTESSKIYRAAIGDLQTETFLELPDLEYSDRFWHYFYPAMPRDLLFDAERGRLYWSDVAHNRIFSVDTNGEEQEELYAKAERMALLSSSRAVCGDAVDYSGDRLADYVVWRPYHIDPILSFYSNVGLWFGAGEYLPEHQWWYFSLSQSQWGLPGDTPLGVDVDADGLLDLTVWRPQDGTWYTCPSMYGRYCNCSDPEMCRRQQFGLPGDYPLAGDFDNDGISDYIVWRPQTGTWFILQSADESVVSLQWGLPGDYPVIGDYDGDSKADLAVWRPSFGLWYMLLSGKGYSRAAADISVIQWGLPGDHPIRGDFDGDSILDLAVWRPNEGNWYLCLSSTEFDRARGAVHQFGLPGDLPIEADFDGDTISDFAVYRPQLGSVVGMWYFKSSHSGAVTEKQFGLANDIPPAVAIRDRTRLLYP